MARASLTQFVSNPFLLRHVAACLTKLSVDFCYTHNFYNNLTNSREGSSWKNRTNTENFHPSTSLCELKLHLALQLSQQEDEQEEQQQYKLPCENHDNSMEMSYMTTTYPCKVSEGLWPSTTSHFIQGSAKESSLKPSSTRQRKLKGSDHLMLNCRISSSPKTGSKEFTWKVGSLQKARLTFELTQHPWKQ